MDVDAESKKRKAEEAAPEEPQAKKPKTQETSAADQAKAAPSDLPEDEGQRQKLAETIRTQIEFYMGDSNFPTDRFLRAIADADDQWVPVETFVKFNRINRFTQNVEFITEALSKSDQFVWSDDKKKIKRSSPLPSVDSIDSRTIMVTGLPAGDEAEIDFEQIKGFFEATYGGVRAARVLKNKEKKLKGVASVEFDTPEKAKEVAAKGTVEWKERKLTFQLKDEYVTAEKAKVKADRAEKDAKKKAEQEAQVKALLEAKVIRKTIVVFTNLALEDNKDNIEKVKTLLEPIAGPVKFVSFEGEPKTTVVRFKEAVGDKVKAALDEKSLKFDETVLEGHLMEGDEETKYWVDNILTSGVGKGKGKRGGRGGRGGKRGGRGRGGGRGGRKAKTDDGGDE